MANNRAAEGLERLNDLGVVHEMSHHYLSMAARSYVYKINDGKECLLVSPTHREIDSLNTLVRKELANEGILDLSKQQSKTCFQDLNWTRNQIANHQNYKPLKHLFLFPYQHFYLRELELRGRISEPLHFSLWGLD